MNNEELCQYGCGRKWDAQGGPDGFEDCVSAYHKKRTTSPMKTEIKRPTLEETAITCPHVKIIGDEIQEMWRVHPDGKILLLDGEHNLVFCSLCWHALRSHAIGDFAVEVGIQIARQK